MLSIQPVLDVVIHVNLVDDLVRILLQRRRKNDNLIVLRHELDELHAARPD